MSGGILVKRREEKSEVHMAGDGNYDTMCGLDANDSKCDTFGAVPTNRKIDCAACKLIFSIVITYKERDFV